MTRTQRHWRPHRQAEQARQLRLQGMDDLADNLQAALVKAGRCKACGRPLFDPVSKERGVGPDCWAKGHR